MNDEIKTFIYDVIRIAVRDFSLALIGGILATLVYIIIVIIWR